MWMGNRYRMAIRKKQMSNCRLIVFTFLMGIVSAGVAFAGNSDQYRAKREGMIKEIEADVRVTSRKIGKKQLSKSVMNAMATVPRHEFVPRRLRHAAYENRPLPIGYGQTISQPYIVALMTDLLDVDGDDIVLEVGTGSGYQAAILAQLVKKIYTIEIVKELGEQAKERLANLGYQNIAVHIGDGYYGLEQLGPFDAIIVTAAANHVPPPLIKQLRPGGKMVIPVGGAFMTQQLLLLEKRHDGKILTKQVLPVIFVPLTGDH
jgi:protein-L-isoaspartate(D-aspartate) O-methyltransferase